MGKERFQGWYVVVLLLLAGLCFTTFQPVIQATIVHKDIAGNIFQIASYVGGLATLYAPWLPLMMSEGTGERTAALFTMGKVALYVLCAIAIIALVCVVLSLVLGLAHKRGASKVFGLIGFICALVVPLVSMGIVAAVQFEMSSPIISIAVLDVRPVCYVQLALAAFGIASVALATRKGRAKVPMTAHGTVATAAH